MSIEIIEEGLHTSFQDLGRVGYQSSGFPISGVMDEFAAVMANYLVGNKQNEAVMEMSFIGPSMTFHENAIIALTGANMSANLNQKEIPYGKAIMIQAGDTLQLRTVKTGLYAYLAISGGFHIPKVLGSKSTVVHADIEGLLGRTIKNGDRIPFKQKVIHSKPSHWHLDPHLFHYIDHPPKIIRYIEGPQHKWFQKQEFEQTIWKATTKSNRMGYRFSGNKLTCNRNEQLLTEATTFGTIQIPPNGQPIVLMADSQPTGGYPKMGQVIQSDIGKISQLRPGQSFRFQSISIEDARNLLRKKESFYHMMHHIIKEKLGGAHIETSTVEL